MTTQTAGVNVNPADETIQIGPLTLHFLITSEQSAGAVTVFEVIVPAGQRLAAPTHSHDHCEETVYGIAGVLTWTVDGKVIDVGPGQALCIPRGAVHRFDNNGAEDVKAVCAGLRQRRLGRNSSAKRPRWRKPPAEVRPTGRR